MRRLLALLVILLAAALSVAPADAQDFRSGLSAYQTRDYRTALSHWRPLADMNQAKAQTGLGFMYYRGQGVMRDSVRAAHWFRRAAEQGEATAQLFLGIMHFFGDGVRFNRELALMWFELAVAGGQEGALEWRENVLETLTTAQRNAAWRRTAEWYKAHALRGSN